MLHVTPLETDTETDTEQRRREKRSSGQWPLYPFVAPGVASLCRMGYDGRQVKDESKPRSVTMDATEIRQVERAARWRSRDQALWWLRHGGYDAIQEDFRDDRLFWIAEAMVEDYLGINMLNAKWGAQNDFGAARDGCRIAVEMRDRLYAAMRSMTGHQVDALAMRVAHGRSNDNRET